MARNIEDHKHLGAMLATQYFQPRQLTIHRVARETGVNPKLLCGTLTGRQRLPIKEAILLARYFGEEDDCFARDQLDFDLRTERRRLEEELPQAA